MRAPEGIRSRRCPSVPLRKYATAPEVRVRVRSAIAALPESSLYAEYLQGQLEKEPLPYVPSAERLAVENARLRGLLGGDC